MFIYSSKVSAQVVVYPVPFTLVGCVSVSRPRALFGGSRPFLISRVRLAAVRSAPASIPFCAFRVPALLIPRAAWLPLTRPLRKFCGWMLFLLLVAALVSNSSYPSQTVAKTSGESEIGLVPLQEGLHQFASLQVDGTETSPACASLVGPNSASKNGRHDRSLEMCQLQKDGQSFGRILCSLRQALEQGLGTMLQRRTMAPLGTTPGLAAHPVVAANDKIDPNGRKLHHAVQADALVVARTAEAKDEVPKEMSRASPKEMPLLVHQLASRLGCCRIYHNCRPKQLGFLQLPLLPLQRHPQLLLRLLRARK